MKINIKKNGLCLFTLAAGLLCSVSLLKAEPENAAAPAYSPAQEKDEDGFYSFFAIVMPLGTRFSEGEYERAVKLAQAAGIKWTREEFFWGDIEPAKGKFSWEKYDRVVETARQNRLNLFGILDYSAAWAGSAGVCSPPRDFQDYGNFVYQTVSRYKDKIKYWEIWNEPNQGVFWLPEPDPAAYTELLKVSYFAAKRADPNCQVMIGGITGSDLPYIEEVYRNGGGNYFDIMDIHPYCRGGSPEAGLRQIYWDLKRLMARYGGEKKIWVSEVSWDTSKSGVSEELQASYLARTYILSLSVDGLDKLAWYTFRNTGKDPLEPEDNFGIVTGDFSPKPAYWALSTVASKLGSALYSGNLELKENQFGFLFLNEGKPILVLWQSKNEEEELELFVDSDSVIITDLMGKERSLRTKAGKLKINISGSPVFLENFGQTLLEKALNKELNDRVDNLRRVGEEYKNQRVTEITARAEKSVKREDEDGRISRIYRLCHQLLKEDLDQDIRFDLLLQLIRIAKPAVWLEKGLSPGKIGESKEIREKIENRCREIKNRQEKLVHTEYLSEELSSVIRRADEVSSLGMKKEAGILSSFAQGIALIFQDYARIERPVCPYLRLDMKEYPRKAAVGDKIEIEPVLYNKLSRKVIARVSIKPPTGWELDSNVLEKEVAGGSETSFPFQLRIPSQTKSGASEDLTIEAVADGVNVGSLKVEVEPLSPLAIKIEPITRPILKNPQINVEIKNQMNKTCSAKVKLRGPADWSFEPDCLSLGEIPPAAAKKASFSLKKAKAVDYHIYPVEVIVETGEQSISKEMVLDFALSRKAQETPKIDADLKEWKDAYPVVLDQKDDIVVGKAISWQGKDDLSAEVYTMWDNENFYIAALIRDDIVRQEQEGLAIWNGDCLEIYMDLDIEADRGTKFYNKDDYHFGFAPLIKNGFTQWMPETLRMKGVEFAWSRTKDGYILEAKIPLSNLPGLEKGKIIGFDISIDDADETPSRENQLAWSGERTGWKDPTVFRKLIFLEENN